ncbi:hypothetical protein Pla22_23980 [Rubripirellula amarantea]|uniref:Competence-damage inducible protein n=1 Tax=Rubripirellula amarantea TaxID=2527999 RepID=A0A5C5WVN7_9BACT|nr:hypothetical protein [Rubripirellula amarantea]TWT54746.1 hypothetical protein Pla22_23980 [Rubripirellula amarantea]
MDRPVDWKSLTKRLSQTDWQIALVVSGGGIGAIERCMKRAGASVNFVEAVVPYSRASMRDYLGAPMVGKSASKETSIQLAQVAFERAVSFSDIDQGRAVGIALVAAMPTFPARNQTNQIHVAMITMNGCQSRSRELDGQLIDRDDAEEIAEAMVAEMVENLTG